MRGRFPLRRLLTLAACTVAWAMLASALTTQQAAAQALPPAVVACMDQHDPTQRLACYDREVPRAVATTRTAGGSSAPVPGSGAAARAPSSVSSAQTPQPTTSPASAATPTSAPPAGTVAAGSAPAPGSQLGGAPGAATRSEDDAFGMTAQIQRKENGGAPPPRLDKLAAHIASVSQKPRGEFIVTLDNGQVWEEAEATSHLPLRTGDDITIKRGVLGAFYMSSRQVLGLRVRRVR